MRACPGPRHSIPSHASGPRGRLTGCGWDERAPHSASDPPPSPESLTLTQRRRDHSMIVQRRCAQPAPRAGSRPGRLSCQALPRRTEPPNAKASRCLVNSNIEELPAAAAVCPIQDLRTGRRRPTSPPVTLRSWCGIATRARTDERALLRPGSRRARPPDQRRSPGTGLPRRRRLWRSGQSTDAQASSATGSAARSARVFGAGIRDVEVTWNTRGGPGTTPWRHRKDQAPPIPTTSASPTTRAPTRSRSTSGPARTWPPPPGSVRRLPAQSRNPTRHPKPPLTDLTDTNVRRGPARERRASSPPTIRSGY